MKKRFSVLSLLSSLVLIGCYDMQYDKFEDYYDAFDDTVYLKYFNDEGTDYSGTSAGLESNFLNEDTQNDFDEDCLVDEEYYAYLAVWLDLDETTNFGDFCVYFRASSNVSMQFRFFIVDELPSSARGFGDLSQEEIDRQREEEEENDDDDEEEDPGPAYDDDYSNPIATASSVSKSGQFMSIYVSDWTIDGQEKGFFTLEPDQYLLMQIYNNTGYGKDAGLDSVELTMTNLIISIS